MHTIIDFVSLLLFANNDKPWNSSQFDSQTMYTFCTNELFLNEKIENPFIGGKIWLAGHT